MNELTLVKQAPLGDLTIDCYTDGQGNYYVTREQIGQALEYPHPKQAIDNIHKRHKKRLDRFSVVLKMRTTDGKKYDTVLYQARGVYEICRHSNQPKADAFYDAIYEVLEGLRLGWLELKLHKGTPLWKEARAASIRTRKAEGDIIQRFVEYARMQGSGHAERYFTSLSALANRAAGIQDRNETWAGNLAVLQLAERVIAAALSEGMAEGLHYKAIYKICAERVNNLADLPGIREG